MGNEKGMTVIALVLTIIVMVVLVAVTISMASNGNLLKHPTSKSNETTNVVEEAPVENNEVQEETNEVEGNTTNE